MKKQQKNLEKKSLKTTNKKLSQTNRQRQMENPAKGHRAKNKKKKLKIRKL